MEDKNNNNIPDKCEIQSYMIKLWTPVILLVFSLGCIILTASALSLGLSGDRPK